VTLNDIIAEIDEKYPNGISSASKVRKMNFLQKRLYRKMRKQTYASYELTPDQPTYPLDTNINDIFQVEIGNSTGNCFTRYMQKKINDTSTDCWSQYYSFLSDVDTGDYIDIYPTPTDNEDTMIIWSYEQPNDLDATQLGTSPSLDPDYHMLFVYYVCKEIAENYRDFDISTGYAIQYNALESEMFSTFQAPEVQLIHSESGW
jgi:hypothetical protein